MAIMGAITYQEFNDKPEIASRPFDKDREGFVPAHGGAVLVLEDYDAAIKRGARIYAEVLGVAAGSDGNHLPQPSQKGQVMTMKRVLEETNLAPEQVDYISAHATSTPLGDLTEIASIKEVFGEHAYNLKINAPKSILGHTCWAAPTVESVAAIMQMHRGKLHPSINIDNIDPAIDLDVCANNGADYQATICMKNSFGFGGINCVSLFRRVDLNNTQATNN
jgi:3-oxoacyl-(acyl-carrier-protein) synthase